MRSSRRRRRVREPWAGPLGSYTPGPSPVHRIPPGPKLLGLAVVSVVLTIVQGPWVAVGTVVLSGVLLRVATVPARAAARALAPVAVAAALLGLYQWWARGWEVGVTTAASLVALVALATVLTASTRTDVLLDTLVRSTGPLRRVGIQPQTVALTIALMLRTIPSLVTMSGEVRDAARARGLGRDPRALLVPFALRAVARAHTTGDALAARGILEEDPSAQVGDAARR
ncbi:energy-coupling factor transporter transmembrane component T family protein [Sanguibacter suaedae]|uniref:Energy-coupling factor transporter transmembrane protein EcfT n=1 Tax=Sanguibacter suaedae TaxID=2795737 RepID=A0A934I4D6_9MICO|nr:energy-coupling factor transporter transmembrane protein EcfT [Sanguibacter suaedae]MBI9115008.1 energy-coupling factor transporter transmembrane protein EcfT [Sanguibacter suaedae]